MSKNKNMHCTSCGTDTNAPILKGNGWVELLLWLCYLVPGLIYTVWRRSKEPSVCPNCKKESLIPAESRAAKSEGRDEMDCPYCAEKILIKANKCKHCGEVISDEHRPAVTHESVNKVSSGIEAVSSSSPAKEKPIINDLMWSDLKKNWWMVVGAFGLVLMLIVEGGNSASTTTNSAKTKERSSRIDALVAYSRPSLPLIPRQSCHPFHTKPATDSRAKLPPRQTAWESPAQRNDAG